MTIERMAADALAVADAEGAGRFHLAGHSMGGLIAQHVAVTARPRVISLSLLCTFGDGKDGARLPPAMLMRAIRTRIGTRGMRRQAMLALVMAPERLATTDRERLASEFASLFGHDLADQPPIVMKQLKAMSTYGVTRGLDTLAGVPTLVVSGAHDSIARPALGRALAEAIPNARYVEFADAGHALPIECAARDECGAAVTSGRCRSTLRGASAGTPVTAPFRELGSTSPKPWPSLVPSVWVGSFDVIVEGMAPAEPRKARVVAVGRDECGVVLQS